VNPGNGGWVIGLSLIIAMMLGVVHLPESWPAWLGWLRPNWLLLVIFFWVIEVPHRTGLLAVWVLGLLVDVLYADPLGLNAFLLAAVTYIAWRFCERFRMYSVLQQCGIVFLLVLGLELVSVFIIGLGSERVWGWQVVLTAVMSMLAWPFVFLLLLRIRTGARVE